MKGTWAAKKPCGHTGETISRRPTLSFGLWMQQIALELKTADKNSRACCLRRSVVSKLAFDIANSTKRLMGASLLVFSNKTDVEGCMSDSDIRQVDDAPEIFSQTRLTVTGASTGRNQDAQMDYHTLQCNYREESAGRPRMGCARCSRQALSLLKVSSRGASRRGFYSWLSDGHQESAPCEARARTCPQSNNRSFSRHTTQGALDTYL